MSATRVVGPLWKRINDYVQSLGDVVIDGDVSIDGELNCHGNYALDLQNIPDLSAKGAGYWFDGVDDDVEISDNINLDLNLNDFSVVVLCKQMGPGTCPLYTSYSSSTIHILFRIQTPTQLECKCIVGGAVLIRSVADIPNDLTDQYHHIGFVSDRDVGNYIYIDGASKALTVDVIDSVTNFDIHSDWNIGSVAAVFGMSNISQVLRFNLALTATEMKALSSGAPVPYKYLGASQIALTSGTLVPGKQYTIDTFVAGDDFANVGGTNVTGNSFVATGTTPTTWTNASSLRRVGCVLQLEQPGIGHNQWLDDSGNELHGFVNGALPVNLPINHTNKYIDLSVTGDTSFVLPAGYLISSIILESNGAIGGGIDIGTTAGGGEIVAAQPITGAVTVLCALVAGASYNLTGADDTIYVTDADGTGWDAASVILRVNMERVV